jgi:ubiquinone/menaquinone biosynthesis C-methylase UbiE
VLGDVRGKDVLELGCGAAQWSTALAGLGAHCVGLDNSARQLEHARRGMATAGVEFPLVHASAERVPLPDASFDVVFCDHGAMSYADPERTIPEAARLLRPGGLFAFNAETPLHFICWDEAANTAGDRLATPYFEGLRAEDSDGAVNFAIGYGDAIRLFRANGFAVEELIELRPPEAARTTYDLYVSYEWARAWPAEHIWRVRRVRR